MNIGKNDLKRQEAEAQEWDSNQLKRSIQKLFKGPLSESNYRLATPKQALETARAQFIIDGVAKESAFATTLPRLLRKLEKCKTSADSVMVLGDYLLK